MEHRLHPDPVVQTPRLHRRRRAVAPPEVPVAKILAFLAQNLSVDELRAAYPQLTMDDVKASLAYAEALVRQGAAAAPTATGKRSALPEPDTSIHKLQLFRALISPFKPGRLLDLGAGKGNFSLAAAQLGWTVTAVDVRTGRLPDPDAESDPERAALVRSITWVQADVREFPITAGDYDLICILGLLHHLEVADQVALVQRCSGTLTLLDTRIAPPGVDREGRYDGAYVREHGATRAERDLVATASWGNERSFRHTEESLLRLVRDCGFSHLLHLRPPHRRDYTFYLCLPRPPRHRKRLSPTSDEEGSGRASRPPPPAKR